MMKKIIDNIVGGGGKTLNYLLAAVLTFAAAQTAQATFYYNWQGQSGSAWWETAKNWKRSQSDQTKTYNYSPYSGGAGDIYIMAYDVNSGKKSGLYKYNANWASNYGYQIKFGNKDQNVYKGHVYVRAGTSDKPIRFYGKEAGYGLKPSSGYSKNILIGDGSSNVDAYLKIEQGPFIFNDWKIGSSSRVGTLIMTGANTIITANGALYIYNGTLTASSATLTTAGDFKVGDTVNKTASVTKSSGNWTIGSDLYVGGQNGVTATFANNGGNVTVSGDMKIAYGGGTGTLTVKGGTVEVASGKWTRFESGGTGTINLEGGTLKTRYIYDPGATSASLLLNGGTLQVNGDVGASNNGILIDSTVNVKVGANGGTINTGAKDFSVPAAVNAMENTTGNLTVTGGGSATFSAMGDFAGAFTVGDNTMLRWFDQDTTVSNYTVEAINLAPGSTLCIDATPTGCDTFNATATNITATAENPARLGLILRGDFSEFVNPVQVFAIDEAETNKITLVAMTTAGVGLPTAIGYDNGYLTFALAAGSGAVWTGLGGDGKLSTDANWLSGSAPVAGNDLDFSGIEVATTLDADIDAAFGAVTMGGGVATFNGDKMKATSFSDTSKVAVGANATVTLDGDLIFNGSNGNVIVNKVGDGGAFIVTGDVKATVSQTIYPVAEAGTGYIVVNGIEVPSGSSLYSTKDVTTQKWVIGPGGITAGSASSTIWCLSNAANDCWIYPYTSDFTISAWTVVRPAIDHHELNTTGYGDSLSHTITLDAGFSDNGKVFIGGTGKVVVNHVTQEAGGQAAYSGEVTVQDTATLAFNAGMKLTSGKITFAAGTTLEIPSTGVEMGALAFSGDGMVTLKVTGGQLADGDYTLVTATGEGIQAGAAAKFTLDAQTQSDAYLVSLDNKTLHLVVGASSSLYVWTGAANDGNKMNTSGNWLGNAVPPEGATVLFPATAATINNDIDGFAPSSITFDYGSGAVTIGGNAITGVAAVTNLSGSVQAFGCRLDFADTYRVHCASQPVNFSGGAYATYPDASISSDTVASHALTGELHFSSDWTIPDQPANNPFVVAPGARVYGTKVTASAYNNTNYHLRIDEGAIATFETVAVAGKLVFRLNGGNLVATGDVTLGGDATGRDFGFYNASNDGTVEAHGIYKSVTGVGLIYHYITNMVVGAGGFGMYRKDYSIQFLKDSRLTAKDNLAIHMPIAEDGPKEGDWGLILNGKTFTIDTAGYTVTFDSWVKSDSGKVVKEGDGELIMQSLTKNYTGGTTVDGGTLVCAKTGAMGTGTATVKANATLAVKSGVNTSCPVTVENGGTISVVGGTATVGGNLTLKSGACLGFNFTERSTVPELAIDSEKTLSFAEGAATNIMVKLSGVWPRGSEKVLTSCGGFAGVNVSLDETSKPDWATGVSVNDDGNIVISVKPKGLVFMVN